MSFYPGQLVVCIHGFTKKVYPDETLPRKGVVYTVRDYDEAFPCGSFIYLEEIKNPPHEYYEGYGEASFHIRRFRPITDSKLAIFRRLLTDIPVDEKERA